MRSLTLRQASILLIHGLVGWALCGAVMGLGMALSTLQTTLIVHAIAAPIFFTVIGWIYFTRFRYTTPLQTGVAFLLIVVFMDFFLVALIINRSLEMFTSLLGTWIPFALIFLSTYLTGLYVEAREPRTLAT